MKFEGILPTEIGTQPKAHNKKSLLDWEAPKNYRKLFLYELSDLSNISASSHRWFNTALKVNEICDLEAIEAPGAIIMLPWGVKILEQYASLIRKKAESHFYQEYSYPSLIPTSYFNPIKDLLDLDDLILNIETSHKSLPKLSLTPTGECAIYHHWKSTIKTHEDLPKKIFQRTKYFRPVTSSKRAGGSVFLSMEASDIFEFHSCFCTQEEAKNEAMELLSFFYDITQETGTHVLWSLRPSWTNQGQLYCWGYGGDAILPSRYSVQVATSYCQGDVFSKRFGINFRKNSESFPAAQSTGAITRRLMFANLFQFMKEDMSLCLHPTIAPTQVMIFLTSYIPEDENMIRAVCRSLEKENIRVHIVASQNKNHLLKETKKCSKLGIPLKILFFGRANHTNIKVIVTRNDTGDELKYDQIDNLKKIIKLALKDIKTDMSADKYRKYVTECEDFQSVSKMLDSHLICSVPLKMDLECIQPIEKLNKGEVLGFCANKPAPCIVTKEKTLTRALISRRI